MGKINVYLPQELEDQVKAAEGLNISAICQNALRDALRIPQPGKKIPPPCPHEVVVRKPGGHRCAICSEPIHINTTTRRAAS